MEEQVDQQVKGECFCMGAGPQLTAVAKAMVPPGAVEHFRNSQIEFLKGMRSLLDARIAKMSRSQPSKGASVPVD